MRDSFRMLPVTLSRFNNYAAQNIVEVIEQGTRNGSCMRHASNSR